MQKLKILMFSDHALSTSGVGCQSRFLINGLVDKGCWSVRQFGAALQHTNYDISKISEDFIIKPIDGFGNPDLLRTAIVTEKPDVILLFTDPRFFIWLWELEDEIHQVCPIAYWHVWDNLPRPEFNDVLYESTDLINCHSYPTYEICKEKFPEKTNFIPHALPHDIYHPLPKEKIRELRVKSFGEEKVDHFIPLWINRNAKRKRPNDVLWAWQIFMDSLKEKHGKSDATLLMHTDPRDQEGPHLMATADMLGIHDSVIFSEDRVSFEQMNALHNMTDCCVNISFAEGFGLATLEAMQVGNPVIAAKTGGLTRQVVDHRDGTENGVALDIKLKSLVGSQSVPYIYEDYCSVEDLAEAFMKMYEEGPEGRERIGKKAREYVLSEFNIDNTIDMWHNTLLNLISDWKQKKRRSTRFEIKEVL